MACLLSRALLLLLALLLNALQFEVGTPAGTEHPAGGGMTEKQLALQRYFAYQTFLSAKNADHWASWTFVADQDSNASLRYALAAVGYAAALTAYTTPAYPDVAIEILNDTIHRMVEWRVWNYIEFFPGFKHQETYPDPVAYKNIMYSGHLLQLVSLYESITGDFVRFGQTGWDFEWRGNDSFNGKRFHYTTGRLAAAVYGESLKYLGGGVPCEPDSIFVICNSYPRNAFALLDVLHNTSWSNTSAEWQRTLERSAVKGGNASESFFKLDYLLFPGMWEPIASMGSDAWALGWIRPWWSSQIDPSDTLNRAARHFLQSPHWVRDQTGEHVHEPSVPYQTVFPFPDDVTTSFAPLIERQFPAGGNRSAGAVAWFERRFGQALDTDGDSLVDSYRYNSSADYRDWSTANLLTAYTLPTNPEFTTALFRGPPFYKLYGRDLGWPHLTAVPYPRVMVSSATYDTSNRTLSFRLVQGDVGIPPACANVTVANVPVGGIRDLLLNGSRYTSYLPVPPNSLVITVPPLTAGTPQGWEVLFH